MKIEQLLVQHFYNSGEVTLQGMGTFTLSPDFVAPKENDKDALIPDNAISFKYNPRATEDDDLINFIVQQTRKMKALAAADLRKRPELLRVAMQDRLHQPYRAKLFPEMEALIAAGLEAGAWGACLSGAGSAILSIASAGQASGVEHALRQKAAELKVPGRTMILEIPARGARISPE